MRKDEELKMTYSGLMLKNGEKMVRVCFQRGSRDYAEGIIPGGRIEKSAGFTEDELEQLKAWMNS